MSNQSSSLSGDAVSRRSSKRSTSRHVLALSAEYDRQVRPFIDLVDSLRNSGVDQDLNLPSIAVIGDQSTGKSSVLEAISGVQLPRGQGMVTRCALELRMKRDEKSQWRAKLQTQHLKQNQLRSKASVEHSLAMTNPEEVQGAVLAAQDKLAGRGKEISHKERIVLEVTSPDVPDLTLIDLPGIILNPTPDQPQDIVKQVDQLIKFYVSREETIILCVIPCHQDIASNKALSVAREYDHTGERTLGVLTRADLTEQGGEGTIVDLIQNKGQRHIKLGYTVVKCRSQEDIRNGVTLQQALLDEKNFFEKPDQAFSKLPASCKGTSSLAQMLTKQLVAHIKSCLPALINRCSKELELTTKELSNISDPVPTDKQYYLIQLLMEYGEELSAATTGDLGVETHFQDGTPLDELKSHCQQLFPKTRAAFRSFELKLETLKPNDDELPRIEDLIEKLRGPNIIGFENYRIFEDLARRKVSFLETPAMTCLEEVTALVHNAFVEIANKQFGRFQFLRYLVIEIVNELFQKLKEEARQELSRMNEAEKVIYSSDTTFTDCLDTFSNFYRFRQEQIGLHSQLTQSGSNLEIGRELSGPSKRQRLANDFTLTEEQGIQSEGYRHSRQKATGGGQQMLRKLKAYFKIVSGRLSDAVPQVIMHNLFKKFPQQVKVKLISHFSKSQAVDEDKVDEKERSVHLTVERLLQEDEDLTRHREELHHKVERLQEGERKLKSFLSTPYGMSS